MRTAVEWLWLSLVVLFWHDVRLDRSVRPPADNLAVLPPAAQRLPLVRLRAVQRERRANVPELHRAVVAAAQNLKSVRERIEGEEARYNGKCKGKDTAKDTEKQENQNAKHNDEDKEKDKIGDKGHDKDEQDKPQNQAECQRQGSGKGYGLAGY